jgi:hypothetical protein
LAIVIPAHKPAFLRETLMSIANQTDQRFQLYIGDDAGPEPLAEIVGEFSERLPLNYHRFEKNLGGISLVQHLERCLRLSREPWVWLFSDDDVMDANCVESFFCELENTGDRHDAYRFNTISIGGDGQLLSENPPHPQNETGGDFLLSRLRGGRNSTMQEIIFSRPAWEKIGGIPEFPAGWASDDAFIAGLGAQKSIRTISSARVQWRLSGQNISSKKSSVIAAQKREASRLFWNGRIVI